ncbi:hypothetical protein KCU67_g17431, partial [Aureobasidium melanogenum]
MSARLPPSTHIATTTTTTTTTTTSISAPINKMDQPWTFERADLAPLPYFEEDDPFLNTAGPQPNHDFQAPFNPFFNAWDSPAAHTIRSNNFSAQQLPVSNSPQAPFPINDEVQQC